MVRAMRTLLVALVLFAGCGGDSSDGATRMSACTHVCSCFTFSTANGQADCVAECTSTTSSTGPTLADNEQCYSCAEAATCGGILSGSACQDECATASH